MLGFFRRKPDAKKELRRVLGDVELPCLPAAAMRALDLLRDGDTSLRDVARAIEEDPGLAVKVLRSVNSSATGRRGITDLGRAVTMLGRGTVEQLLTSVAVVGSLPKNVGGAFDLAAFWRTSARRATTARQLAQRLHPRQQLVSYTAALLQDMALPIMASALGDRYAAVLERWRAEGGNLAAIEVEALGCSHAEVAGWMCLEWNFPRPLTGAIVSHHGDDQGEEDSAPPAVILVADIEGEPSDAQMAAVAERAVVEFALSSDDAREAVEQGFADAEGVSSLLAS